MTGLGGNITSVNPEEENMVPHNHRRLDAPQPRGKTRRSASAGAICALVASMGAVASALAAPCIDTSLPIAVEEQRLPNKLTTANANPFAVDLLDAAGFTHFEADFINSLGGLSSVDPGVSPSVVVS